MAEPPMSHKSRDRLGTLQYEWNFLRKTVPSASRCIVGIVAGVHMSGLVPGRFWRGGDFCLRVEIKIQVVTSFALRGFF